VPKLSRKQVVAWIATVVFAALMIARSVLIYSTNDGSSGFDVLSGIALGVLIIFGLSLRLVVRESVLRRLYPGAFVASIGGYPPLTEQLDGAARAMGGRRGRFYPGYLSVVVDEKSLQLVGGFAFGMFGKPRIRAVIPLRDLVDVHIAKVEQGKWNLNTLELIFQVDGKVPKINLTLLGIRWGLPLGLSRPTLEQKCEELRRAVAKITTV
jgi:hypothetical protein